MTFNTSYDHVILGGGIVGAWCFERLSGQGRVMLLEQGRLGSGVTGFSGGIIRAAHGDREATRAAALGMEAYERLIRDAGAALRFVNSGYLHFAESAVLSGIAALMGELGREAQVIGADQLGRFGQLDVRAQEAIWEPDAGYLNGAEVLGCLIGQGVRKGGQFIDGLGAVGLRVSDSAVVGVETGQGL